MIQTRTIDLPSDSHFALSMKSQQAAEREEQQRIKNLVLNYELNDDDQHDGTKSPLPQPIVQRSIVSKRFAKRVPETGFDHFSNNFSRAERNGRAPRARRLNLSDVDWYGNRASTPQPPKPDKENRPNSASVDPYPRKKSD